jgi:hypothetical protein
MRKRIGPKEQLVLNSVLKTTRSYQIFKQSKNEGETYFNNQLINVLKQSVDVENRKIHMAKLFAETFRPECYVKGAGDIPLIAFECKKLNEQFAKARWKEGLSQAILYSHFYKSVVLLFYDYTKGGRYAEALNGKGTPEAQFAESLRDAFRIYIVALKPQR